jgi:RecB family endonuclease NucS
VRLIVARCEVSYAGRLATVLPMAVRLLVLKADGSVMVHSDSGGYKPQNCGYTLGRRFSAACAAGCDPPRRLVRSERKKAAAPLPKTSAPTATRRP